MSRGRLKSEDEKSIQQNYLYLKQNLKALDIVDYLYQHEVITLEDKDKICHPGLTRIEQNEILLNILLTAGPFESFNYFLKSLEPQYKSILQHMKITAKEQETLESSKLENISLKKEMNKARDVIKSLMEENKSVKIKTAKLAQSLEHSQKEINLLKAKLAFCTCDKDITTEGNNVSADTNEAMDEFQMWCGDALQNVKGKYEITVLKGGHVDAERQLSMCLKYPSHDPFHTVEGFKINNLPVGYCEQYLFRLITNLAELTVRVDVAMTSLARPEFLPGTKIPYPFSYLRGSTTVRTGSGFVTNVTKFTHYNINSKQQQTCTCSKCKQSTIPSKEFWQITVKTAEQVVFDNVESNHTSIRLFYDKHDCPLVSLDHGVKYGSGTIVFETCDVNICKQLEKALTDFSEFDQKVQIKYKGFKEALNLSDEHAIIVSYPHGCTKKISIGKLHGRSSLVSSCWKWVYDTGTCPGSCGAPVYLIGEKDLRIHCGSMDNGFNYSETFF